jgi:Ni,Fe-hydrogenase maturation factor
MNVLVAANLPSGCLGFQWTVAGDEGAVEVPDYLVRELVDHSSKLFYVVESQPAKVEAEKKPVAKAAAKVEKPEVEVSEDLADAIDTASATKSRRK